MKRVIIVPVTETGRFPGRDILARGGAVAAPLRDTFEGRSRSAFGLVLNMIVLWNPIQRSVPSHGKDSQSVMRHRSNGECDGSTRSLPSVICARALAVCA
jgi:hypothetical protein